jgi:acetyl-CoA C-acetyltransferase
MGKVFIAAAKRTAIGAFNGSLTNSPAVELGAETVKAVLREARINPAAVNALIAGNVLSAGLGQGVARQIALKAGLPVETPAYAVNMVCGSGLLAVIHAYAAINAGLGDIFIAGGAENMSAAPYLIPQARQGLRMGDKPLIDHVTHDALTDAFENIPMGITAENIAGRYGITREAQDTFAYESQRKALAAIDSGAFKKEIVPVAVMQGKQTVVFDTDEHPNRRSTPEKLASLKPAFTEGGTVTAGNSSGINDGAAFLLIVSESAINRLKLPPIAEVIGVGAGGVEPAVMGLGCVPAVKKAVDAANITLSDIDIYELNEAFAAQALGVIRELSKDHGVSEAEITAKTNLKGGAIALGHPVGASGARIAVTLTHVLSEKKANTGLAALCVGGGMGVAVIIKRGGWL